MNASSSGRKGITKIRCNTKNVCISLSLCVWLLDRSMRVMEELNGGWRLRRKCVFTSYGKIIHLTLPCVHPLSPSCYRYYPYVEDLTYCGYMVCGFREESKVIFEETECVDFGKTPGSNSCDEHDLAVTLNPVLAFSITLTSGILASTYV